MILVCHGLRTRWMSLTSTCTATRDEDEMMSRELATRKNDESMKLTGDEMLTVVLIFAKYSSAACAEVRLVKLLLLLSKCRWNNPQHKRAN